jgi:hypothetical protein
MDLGQLAEDAAKGAAAGSVVPGIGTALGAVGGIVLDLAPEVGRWLFGADAAPVVSAVQSAVGAVTGTGDVAAQVAALADPGKAAELRVELARIAAGQAAAAEAAAQAALVTQLSDVANARASTVQLAQSGSGIAWGAPVVSIVVLVTFGVVVTVALTRTLPPNAEPVLNVLMGTLGAMATSVVGYWVGSSAGSARKDEHLATLATRT